MRHISLLLAIGVLAGPSPLHAQGATYRIKLYQPWSVRLAPEVRATLPALREDSLPLPRKDGGTLMVPRRDVMSIDSLVAVIPRGQLVRHDMISGAIVGGIAGAGFGFLTYHQYGKFSFDSRPANIAAGAVGGAVAGALIGAALGSLASRETWRRIWPSS